MIQAGAFPLFSTQMYLKLGTPYASTVLACITLVLGFCPLVLLVYGKRLRARSKVASALLAEAEAEEEARLRNREETRQKEKVRAHALGLVEDEKKEDV